MLWEVEQLQQQLTDPPLSWPVLAINTQDHERLTQLEQQLQAFVAHYQTIAPQFILDWAGFIPAQPDAEPIAPLLSELISQLEPLQQQLQQLSTEHAWPLPAQLDSLPVLVPEAESLLSRCPVELTAALSNALQDAQTVAQLQHSIATLEHAQRLHAEAMQLLSDTAADWAQIFAVCEQLQQAQLQQESVYSLSLQQGLLQQYAPILQMALADNTLSLWSLWQLLYLLDNPPTALNALHHPAHADSTALQQFTLARQAYNPTPSPVVALTPLTKWFKWLPWKKSRLPVLSPSKQTAHQAAHYASQLGVGFQSAATDWDNLQAVVMWSQHLSQLVGETLAANWLAHTDPVAAARQWFALNAGLGSQVLYLAQQQGLLPAKPEASACAQLPQHWQQRQQLLAQTVALFENLPALHLQPIFSIYTALQQKRAAEQQQSTWQQWDWVQTAFGDAAAEVLAQPQQVLQFAEWVQQVQQVVSAPLNTWLLQDPHTRCPALLQLQQCSQHAHLALQHTHMALAQLGSLDWVTWLPMAQPLSQVVQRLRRRLNGLAQWENYTALCQFKQQLAQAGLAPIVEAILSQRIAPAQAVLQWRYGLRWHWLQQHIRQHPLLSSLTAETFHSWRQQFVEFDAQQCDYQRAQIRHDLLRRDVPQGNGSGKVAEFTELFLLEHELNKKQRHLPIRQLMQRAGRALQALQPCFFMSPLSVAQYLPPETLQFDLLIIDEASQVRPQDALGALLRCQQHIIVGDSRQLPPTRFFERITEQEPDNDSDLFSSEESILDVCRLVYPSQQLNWHYRSVHESLIAFANAQFYDNQLLVVPAPFARHPHFGIQRHYLPTACYAKGENADEAAAIVAAVQQHCREHAQRSLGIATFNLAQQTLIADLCDQASNTDDVLAAWLKVQEHSAEPFFIKNLENVQGDERDVILLSTTYGKNAEGQLYQRFGPLATEAGWRRLNVVITRARQQLQVFTSLTAQDIRVTEESRRGVQALQAWLSSIESHSAPIQANQKAQDISEDRAFTQAIAHLLTQAGYRVALNVGVASFRVPVAICHPQEAQRYVLGIVYDGGHYHQLPTLTERERLRLQVLQAKGWQLHHIDSLLWFKQREQAKVALLQAAADAVAQQLALPAANIEAEN